MTLEEIGKILLTMQANDKKRDELLAKMNKKLEEHDELLAKMDKKLEEHDKLLAKMDKKLGRHDEKIEEHDDKFSSIISILEVMQANIGNLNTQVDSIKKDLRSLSGRVAVIEEEHGGKLQLLLDNMDNSIQKVYATKEQVDSHEDRLDEYDVRIRILESKASNS